MSTHMPQIYRNNPLMNPHMKKFNLLAMALLPALGVIAQSSLTSTQRAIGYTVTDQIDQKGVMVGQAGTFTMGAYMPGSRLEDYKGCKVIGIRVAVARDMGRTNMVLNTNSGTAIEPLHEQKQRLYEGWNEVFFNGFEYEISGENDIFYGFDYTETSEMVAAEEGGLCTVGEDYSDAFMLMQGGDYYPVSGAGMLCIQLIVDVTNMPLHNMSLGFFDYGFKYKTAGEGLQIFTTINNVGLDPVSSYRMACRIDDNEPVYVDVEPETPLAYGQSASFDHTFSLENMEAGGHDVFAYIDQVNGEPFDGLGKGRGGRIAIYSESLPRTASYLEVYADQGNVNSYKLDDGLKVTKKDLGDKIIVVKNFRPGNTLAVEEGAYLHSLYAYTWPSFTSNRFHFPGEQTVAYDMNDYLQIFSGDFTAALLENIVMQDFATPSFADVTLKCTMHPGRDLEVKASGQILPEAKSIFGDLALTLMLVEDGVKGTQQTGNGRPSAYTHDDVLRGYITPATGAVIDSSATSFDESFSFTVPEEWNVSNMRVVAILTQAGEPNAVNLYDFDIINAAQSTINDQSGIATVGEEAAAGEPQYYNLDGIRVPASGLMNGIYIRVDADGSRHKIMK